MEQRQEELSVGSFDFEGCLLKRAIFPSGAYPGGDKAEQRDLQARTKMGERFTQAVAVNSIQDSRRTLIIHIHKAITTANLRCNLKRYQEAGTTKVTFSYC